jgi:hypothetical protein
MPPPKSTARVDHDLVQEARVDALVDAVGRTDADNAIAGDSCGLATAPSDTPPERVPDISDSGWAAVALG